MVLKPQALARITTNEALHRLKVRQNAETLLNQYPAGSEKRKAQRQEILNHAKHYRRMAESLCQIVEEDLI